MTNEKGIPLDQSDPTAKPLIPGSPRQTTIAPAAPPLPPPPPAPRPPLPPKVNARILSEMQWLLDRVATLPLTIPEHNRVGQAVGNALRYMEELEQSLWPEANGKGPEVKP